MQNGAHSLVCTLSSTLKLWPSCQIQREPSFEIVQPGISIRLLPASAILAEAYAMLITFSWLTSHDACGHLTGPQVSLHVTTCS